MRVTVHSNNWGEIIRKPLVWGEKGREGALMRSHILYTPSRKRHLAKVRAFFSRKRWMRGNTCHSIFKSMRNPIHMKELQSVCWSADLPALSGII